MDQIQQHFGMWEYVVFILMMAISASIGVYHRLTGGKQRTVAEYLLADRRMGVLPVAISLVVSFMSAVTILGGASENYSFGTQFMVLNVSYIFGTPLVAYVYLPVFFRLRLTSAYEYLERRFGRTTRVIASVVFHVQMIFYMGIVLYAPALAVSAVTGLSKWSSIMSLGIVCTFYSTVGGMKAVLWTDVFQAALIFAAVLAVLLRGFLGADSFADVFRVADSGGRLEFFNTRLDPTVRHTLWTQAIGGIFTYTSIYGVNQAQVQRLLTVGDLNKSQMSLFISWPVLTVLNVMMSLCGLLVYYHYRDCDPLTAGRINSFDQLLPVFVMDFLSEYQGIPGLFVSGIFSATLSTISSALNSLAAVTLEDYLKPCVKLQWSDTKQAFISKILVLLYGIVCIALTYVAEQLGGVLQSSLTVFGVVGGPLLGLFSLGMFSTRANQKGAVFGFICSLSFVCWIGFGAIVQRIQLPKLLVSVAGCNDTFPVANGTIHFEPDNFDVPTLTMKPYINNEHVFYLYRLSYMWLAPMGFVMVMLLGWMVSLMQSGGEQVVHADLLSPPFKYWYGLDNVGTSKEFRLKVNGEPESEGVHMLNQTLTCETKL